MVFIPMRHSISDLRQLAKNILGCHLVKNVFYSVLNGIHTQNITISGVYKEFGC